MKRPITQDQPLSLRISVTDKCEFRCLYCMPSEGVCRQSHTDLLTFEQIIDFVRMAKNEFALTKVHLTGGEPLVRKGIVDLVSMIAAVGVDDLALTTNACKLAKLAGDLKNAGLHRVNVSLDSLQPDVFSTLTRGGNLSEVIDGIDAAIDNDLGPIKFNTVVLRDYNYTQIPEMARWAISRGCIIRFLELMPIGCAKPMLEELYVPSDEIIHRLATSFDLKPLAYKPGTSARYFGASADGCGDGLIGIISGQSTPFCSSCRRLRLTSTGKLITCLARGQGPYVGAMLCSENYSDRESLVKIISDELEAKAHRGDFDTGHAMVAVGG
ncbi:MAG: GTP 3',8-cyclase MoaA [bacterium]|nr:GTP 3',8-cyclase MoaA [bacterium]